MTRAQKLIEGLRGLDGYVNRNFDVPTRFTNKKYFVVGDDGSVLETPTRLSAMDIDAIHDSGSIVLAPGTIFELIGSEAESFLSYSVTPGSYVVDTTDMVDFSKNGLYNLVVSGATIEVLDESKKNSRKNS